MSTPASPDGTEVLLTLRALPARRIGATGMLGGLGVLLIWIVGTLPTSEGIWTAVLALWGAVMILGAWWQWRATEGHLILTREALWSSDGTRIAALSEIRSVDRGLLAFKPSGGFLLRLETRLGLRWCPGLWWRLGRSVGVGGITPSGEGRAMADMILIMLKQRDGTAV